MAGRSFDDQRLRVISDLGIWYPGFFVGKRGCSWPNPRPKSKPHQPVLRWLQLEMSSNTGKSFKRRVRRHVDTTCRHVDAEQPQREHARRSHDSSSPPGITGSTASRLRRQALSAERHKFMEIPHRSSVLSKRSITC